MFLAQNNPDVQHLFGTISPPTGMIGVTGSPQAVITNLISKGLLLFITVASLLLLMFLLWGALDWILSGGEKDKIEKAQRKITNAVLGYIIMFVMFALFGIITGDILGIVKKDANGSWTFTLPTLGGTTSGGGGGQSRSLPRAPQLERFSSSSAATQARSVPCGATSGR